MQSFDKFLSRSILMLLLSKMKQAGPWLRWAVYARMGRGGIPVYECFLGREH